MKNALRLIAAYFAYLTLYIFLGTFLYSIFQNALNFVVGSEIVFFQTKILLSSFFCIAYSACFFICPLIAIYRVRRVFGILQTAAYILICFVTWFAIFPSIFFLEKKAEKYIDSKKTETILSKNFFRETDKKIWYFTKNFDYENKTKNENLKKNESAAVIIDKSEDGIVTFEITENSGNSELAKLSEPFKEIGIKKTLDFTKVFSLFDINLLVGVAKNSAQNGFWRYLQFLSIAFLLCSLYGISYFFDWRLLNVLGIFCVTIFAVFFNAIFYLPATENFRNYISGLTFFDFLENYISEPFVFIFNVALGIIFIVAGCVQFVLRRLKEKRRN